MPAVLHGLDLDPFGLPINQLPGSKIFEDTDSAVRYAMTKVPIDARAALMIMQHDGPTLTLADIEARFAELTQDYS